MPRLKKADVEETQTKFVVIKSEALLSTADAGERLGGLTGRRVIQLADRGLLPCVRLSGGQRIFRIEDVDRLAQERAAAK
jgi:hypothetical protein